MNEQDLVFLISQPRSGSTMLQKILGTHRDILTLSEPWVMLHLAYSLKEDGIYAEYNRQTEHRAFNEFIHALPGGRKDYVDRLRSLCMEMYSGYLSNANKRIFLDKTPRYYFIIDELLEIFPQAKLIFLRRHPVSVLYSVIGTWTRKNWYRLSDFRHDIVDGFFKMENYRDHPAILTTRYEDLVIHPDVEIQRICNFLSIEYYGDILDYDTSSTWNLGDHSEKLESGGVDPGSLELWKTKMLTFQQWRILWDYMEMIGDTKLKIAGYDYEDTRKALVENCPGDNREEVFSSTYSLAELLEGELKTLHDISSLENENIRLKKHIDNLQEKIRHLSDLRNGKIFNIEALKASLRRARRK